MSFHGVTALECVKCNRCFKMDVILANNPTRIEWASLWSKIALRDNVCLDCKRGEK